MQDNKWLRVTLRKHILQRACYYVHCGVIGEHSQGNKNFKEIRFEFTFLYTLYS